MTLLNAQKGTTIKVAQKGNSIFISINVDFPLLTPCSLVVIFPPEIKIDKNEIFQTSLITSNGFLSSVSYSSHIPYNPTATTGTPHN